MAEKNTHSILETIKKKMLKIDQKSEQTAKVSEGNEEFQYISSGAPKESAASVETKTSAPVEPKFEDNLGLDLEAKSAPVKPAEKAGGMGSFDDFNLDDLDLDEEEKTFAVPLVKSSQPTVAQAATPEVKEEIEEEDLEEFEDDVDFEGEFEEEAEEEVEEGIKEEVVELENTKVTSDVGPLDWLGNPENSSVETDELNLDVDAEIEEKVEAPKVEEVKSEDDLEHLGEEVEELDVESEEELEENPEHSEGELEELEVEQQEESDLLEKEEDLEEPDLDSEHLEEGRSEEDLEENLKHPEGELEELEGENEEFGEEELEEAGAEESSTQAAPQKPSDDLDFSDLEQEDDFLESPKAEKELPSFDGLAKANEAEKTQQPVAFEAMKPVVERHEIDLEFEKELMGFRSDASEKVSTPQIPPINQPINQMPVQNNVSVMNQQTSEVKVAEASPYDATVRQVGDSVKKLLDAKNVVSGISSFSQSPALAELALHLMEPKIEKWFNDNLPELVEKVVREEIKKMIPKE